MLRPMDESSKPSPDKQLPKMVSIKTISGTLELLLSDNRTVKADIKVNDSAVTIPFNDPDVAKHVTHGLAIGNLLPMQRIVQGMGKIWKEAIRTWERSMTKHHEEANAESQPPAQDGP